jgi:hypothetical protein
MLIAGLGLAGAGLAKPYIANAAATTITIWWNQGFYAQEDAAFHAIITDWEKASGNKAQVTLLPGQALNKKSSLPSPAARSRTSCTPTTDPDRSSRRLRGMGSSSTSAM